ncbi:MAG: hypothetical protein BMS9Abin13_470 [Patescibacteria group bacterium]|nr:MAG: hypothetical protein BMS9Abin13_470 [Patescibacteria group bacterium]
MIYFYHGTDTQKVRARAHEVLDVLQGKRPGASLFKMDDESFNERELEELVFGAGLFEHKHIVFMDNVMREEGAIEFILEKIADIAASEHAFVVIQEKVDKKTLAKITKHAARVEEFSLPKAPHKKTDEFNIFSLTDALGRKDKKQAWVLLQKAIKKGVSPEEAHGILFWQVKNMMIARSSSSAADAGLNPFVYKKALSFSNNFNDHELTSLSSSLVDMYHNARRGGAELSVALEKFILSL